MPRLSILAKEQADPSVLADFEAFEKARGKVPNLFATIARRPGFMRSVASLLRETMSPGEVSGRLKELTALRVSRLNACEYCIASHTKLAREAGASEDDLLAVADPGCASLSPAESAALRFADAMAGVGGRVPEPLFAEVRGHWSEGAVVEIAAVVAAFSLFNRLANSLEIEITK